MYFQEKFKAQREKEKAQSVEQVGKELRAMMPWIKPVEITK